MVAHNPLVLPLCALIGGLVAARLSPFHFEELGLAVLSVALLCVLALWRARRIFIVPALALMAILGCVTAELHRRGPAPELNAEDNETLILSGCVADAPSVIGDRVRFAMELEPGAEARVTLALLANEPKPALRYGQVVEIEARVRRPRNFGNPGSFDFVGYLARQDTYWLASARGAGKLKLLPGVCAPAWKLASFRTLEYAAARLDRLYGTESYEASMLRGILLGDSSGIQKVWTEHFRRTGTYHALVISGLHITVLAGTLLTLFRWAALPLVIRLLLAGLVACGYAIVTGMQPPVMRAAGGFVLFLIASYFYRRGRVLNLLAAVAIVYLLVDPEQLFEASFQLSFLAVAAIGALAMPVMERTSGRLLPALPALNDPQRDPGMPPHTAQARVELRLLAETVSLLTRIPQHRVAAIIAGALRLVLWLYEMILVSAAVQLGLLLPMIFYFHRVSLTSLSANVIVVPLTTPIVPLGFFAILTGWHWPAQIVSWLLHLARITVDWHAQWEPSWRIPDPPLWLGLTAAAMLILLAVAIQGSRFSRIIVLAGSLLLVLPAPAPELAGGEFELTAIDVGQGDSLLLVFPDRRTLVVDGGGIPTFDPKYKPKLEIGEDVVSPYLWSRGIQRIDVLAMTHAHDDHARGLVALIENFKPRELWTGATPNSKVWEDIVAQAQRFGTRIIPMRAGDRRNLGGVAVRAIAPHRDYNPAPSPKNNDSLVLALSFGRHRFLLTGDMERQVEERLVYEGAITPVDVLKVGHHGSKTSTIEPFFEAARPAFALISAGAYNSYGHPHQEVLNRLEGIHTRISRTDQSGLTTIRSDGKRLSVESYGGTGARYSPFAPD